jgi:hypothetical protein
MSRGPAKDFRRHLRCALLVLLINDAGVRHVSDNATVKFGTVALTYWLLGRA